MLTKATTEGLSDLTYCAVAGQITRKGWEQGVAIYLLTEFLLQRVDGSLEKLGGSLDRYTNILKTAHRSHSLFSLNLKGNARYKLLKAQNEAENS